MAFLKEVTAAIGRFAVDFVNLRTESYMTDSRIPTIKFGSPLEDSLRRDLTINALYYNIHTQQVEDFTQQGLDDLQKGIIRTPLPALTTLTDDPLRCLRAIRFACRFDFKIVEELQEAFMNPEVVAALETKVSKERVMIELELMLKASSAISAIALLQKFKLLSSIFMVPPAADDVRQIRPTLLRDSGLMQFHEESIGVTLLSELLTKRLDQLPHDAAASKSILQCVTQPGETRKVLL